MIGLQPVDNLLRHNWKAIAVKIVEFSQFFAIKDTYIYKQLHDPL